MSMLETATQPARTDHCGECMQEHFGPVAGPAMTLALIALVGWAKQWLTTRRVKEDRNSHAARAQELAVKVASLSPPPMPAVPVFLNVPGVHMPGASVPPPASEPPRDLAGDSIPPEIETADTVPPRGKR